MVQTQRSITSAARVAAVVPLDPAPDPILSPQQTAEYIGLTIPTLQRQRTDGTGPRFLKLGARKVGYRLSDIRSWLDERVAASTADARDKGLTS
ncbi:MAG: AlpA family phage regulatory protein [Hyphomicrobium zavarzinii]|nr:AlpA family phage regulatory protein [Hyphomicrobium zavarzinii]